MTMKLRNYFGFSIDQQAEIWLKWKQGNSLSDIGRVLRKNPGSVHHLVAFHGGISPPFRKRSENRLTITEREEISRGLAASKSIRQIAYYLQRAPSTVSREIFRHGGKNNYRANDAEQKAWDNASRPKEYYLNQHPVLKNIVKEKLAIKWSPEQISGWLKLTYPKDRNMQISHETIYKSLFIQSRGLLKKELCTHLRSKRMMRRPKNARINRLPRGQIIDGLSIRQRPPEIEDRAIPGHWEGDLLSGSKNTHIATLVERQSRFTILVKLKGKDTISVVDALRAKILTLPQALRKTLTWDRGMELAYHKQLTIATNIQIYFCDPQSPWQRGTNENTNRLLRQYFPKSTDLAGYSEKELDHVALMLNLRPRKILDFLTPFDKLKHVVALTS
jgi:IS30 family transposase